MKRMVAKFKEKISVTTINEEEYARMVDEELQQVAAVVDEP